MEKVCIRSAVFIILPAARTAEDICKPCPSIYSRSSHPKACVQLAHRHERFTALRLFRETEDVREALGIVIPDRLSRQPKDRVWTILLDVEKEQIDPPLGQFQHTSTERDEMYGMVMSMNNASDKPHRESDLRGLFDALWPELEKRIEEIRAEPPADAPTRRNEAEIIAEVLDVVRGMNRQMNAASFQQEKTLRLADRIYWALFREDPPPLTELRSDLAARVRARAHMSAALDDTETPHALREPIQTPKVEPHKPSAE